MTSPSDPAMLYLVATPIGNLADISERALEVLRSVELIASEDTRHTMKLLTRYDIHTRQMAFHAHNETRVQDKVLRVLKEGRDVALVSDAGTPGIADPGFSLVRRCHEEALEVTMVPGPCALVMALVLSALPMHAFTFRGFPPRKPGKRRRFLAQDVDSPHTQILYESPYRIEALVADALEVYGDRQAALCNDLTKRFEAVVHGSLSELLGQLQQNAPRGEYVLVVHGAAEPGPASRKLRRAGHAQDAAADDDQGTADDHGADDDQGTDDDQGADDDATAAT